MKRKEFISVIGKGGIAITVLGCLGGCNQGSNPTSPSTLTNIDFSLNLNETAYSSLNTVGGSVSHQGVLVARIDTNTFDAVAQACNHQGTTIQLELGNHRFHCPNHGSNFDLNGNVINGPATVNLQKFNTELNGTVLRVFS